MEDKDMEIYKSENIYEERSYLAGKKAGIRELVRWEGELCTEHIKFAFIKPWYRCYCKRCWQAKLKGDRGMTKKPDTKTEQIMKPSPRR